VDMDISMDIHGKSMDMDMDAKFHIHGKPGYAQTITSTGDKLFIGVNIDDLEWP